MKILPFDNNSCIYCIMDCNREVEDFLGIGRDKLIHEFYQGKPRKILKEIILNDYLITR